MVIVSLCGSLVMLPSCRGRERAGYFTLCFAVLWLSCSVALPLSAVVWSVVC